MEGGKECWWNMEVRVKGVEIERDFMKIGGRGGKIEF